ncbi:MAG: hypothetical protein JW768_06590 [Chitinispirillaceae bacterium]|nr:hypothetical protein [Chitinispirillaceae bacterium]
MSTTLVDPLPHGPVASVSAINKFLVKNRLLIKNNPAISPDLTLDFPSLVKELIQEADGVSAAIAMASSGKPAPLMRQVMVWPKSYFSIGSAVLFVVESTRSGDCALVTGASDIPRFEGTTDITPALKAVPLYWNNLVLLKKALVARDPGSTIFPRADERLKRTSLGIGARFTTLHWPAVAWVMKELGLPLTANQNSVPRELVYDVNALLEKSLEQVPFPFIGGSVPEGHQGQSMRGMSHASIITMLKHGFHHKDIPWGFNADHQPIGGRFDAIESELVEGSLFASYITYDLSPELALHEPVDDPDALELVFKKKVDRAFYEVVREKITSHGLLIPEPYLKKMVTYLMPAMQKLKRRDQRHMELRAAMFHSEAGRRYLRELSIDELSGETSPETLAVCLAMADALGMKFDFIAPNIGFQKNCPYGDASGLRKKIQSLFAVAKKFEVSIGFHSGSGKSEEDYRIIGSETGGNFEIKTSGRYTYEMGVALSRSSDPADRKLWMDWYAFGKELVVTSAFSPDETPKCFAREFITATLAAEGITADGVFASPDDLRQVLDSLKPSPDHVFWFEYNFLFILAAHGSIERLGDHSIEGYAQRARFYGISDQARLLYARGVAKYILFLAETTGMASADSVAKARKKLAAFKQYQDLLADIA